MIRFLQKDSRVVKSIFIVIISVACITMVVTLVPGIFADQNTSADTYATVGGAGWKRFFTHSDEISTTEVQTMAARAMQQQRLPDMYLQFIMPRVAQELIQETIELQEARRMGLNVTDDDLRHFLHTGMFGQALFPNGQYIGDDRYAVLIQENFNISRQQFETQLKREMEENRLKTLVTSSVNVSDSEVRTSYKKQGTKIKFQYAVLSADDIQKQISPSDSELQTYFRTNGARYANAVPESRKIQYFAFDENQLPGGVPKVSDQEVTQYYQQHQSEYKVDEQVKARHILIKVDNPTDAKEDAAAKKKAQDVLDQLHKGANFADLAKKYSDDPGSKEQGGDLGFFKHGAMVSEFDQAAFSLQPGQTSGLVKTKYGYHIIQVEERQNAHLKTLDEVKGQILAALTRQKEAGAEQTFAQQLQSEAAKSGLQKTADAHHLQVSTTDYLAQGAIVPGVADGSKMLTGAFAAKVNAAPQMASTGEGFAVFQVTEVKPAHAPSFDEYKAHILDDYRQEKIPQLLTEKATQLAIQAKGGDLEKAAKTVGATLKTSDLVDRTAQVPDVGQLSSTATQLFDLNAGQVSGALNTGRTAIVAKILDKQEPSADDIAKNFEQTREQLVNEKRNELFEVFVGQLMEKYQKEGRIRLNRKAQLPGSVPGM
jgi:peptidyl-prolyl cis-trans isomerase D